MDSLTSAFVAVAVGCCAPALHAQSPSSSAPVPDTAAPDDTANPVARWWSGDWRSGWESGRGWRALASPYTYHYSYNPAHTHVYMLGLERERVDGFLFGASVFRNSFGQPSAYAYLGQHFDHVWKIDRLFGQLTGGILYGYKAPYADKVPFNYRGWSPGVVASLGWRFTPTWSGQVNLLGNSALMFQLSADLK